MTAPGWPARSGLDVESFSDSHYMTSPFITCFPELPWLWGMVCSLVSWSPGSPLKANKVLKESLKCWETPANMDRIQVLEVKTEGF